MSESYCNNKKTNVIQCIINEVEKASFASETEPDRLNFVRSEGVLYIRAGDCYQRVYEKNILYVEAGGSYCTFHLAQGRKMLISSPLSDAESALTPGIFLRAHRSYLVNVMHIERLYSTSVIVGGKPIPVSKHRKKEFFSHLNILSFGHP